VIVETKAVIFEVVSQGLRLDNFHRLTRIPVVRSDHHAFEQAGHAVEAAAAGNITQRHALQIFHRHEKDL